MKENIGCVIVHVWPKSPNPTYNMIVPSHWNRPKFIVQNSGFRGRNGWKEKTLSAKDLFTDYASLLFPKRSLYVSFASPTAHLAVFTCTPRYVCAGI